MSLYNLLHGQNPFTPVLLRILDIDQPNGKWKSGRFRDIHVNETGDKIILYTRNGGGNREHFDYEEDKKEAGPNCGCTGCTITYHLPKHPNYLNDRDDDFDCTYAYVEFSVPEEYKLLVKEFAGPIESVHAKFEKTINEMKKMDKKQIEEDPRFKPFLGLFEQITKLK